MSLIDNTLRDPDIVSFIQGQAEVMAQAQAEADDRSAEIAALQEAGGVHNIRKAKRLKVELNALKSKIALAQDNIRRALDIEAERDRLMGEGRDTLIRAKLRGEEVEVREVERASFALNEHGGRIINRAGPNRGLPALVYERGASIRTLTGIRHAFARGHLNHHRTGEPSERLLQIGQAYAENYAKSDPLKAVDASQVGGGGFGPRGPQVAAVEASAWLSIAREGLKPRQRAALDLICGEGHTLGGAAKAMERPDPDDPKKRIKVGIPSLRRALCGGLARVARNHAEHAEKVRAREVVTVGARLRVGMKMEMVG